MSECLSILKALIRLNSENPPGNTRKNIEWIQQWAERNGIHVQTQWYEKNQGNIILTVGIIGEKLDVLFKKNNIHEQKLSDL